MNEPSTGQINVLMIDDSRADFELTKAGLSQVENTRIDLEWAASFDAGREAAASGKYDACLIDYRLGMDNGIDLIRELTATHAHIPLIIVTGMRDPELDRKAQEAGAVDYLVKEEANGQMIERTIRYAIDRRRIEAHLEQLALTDALTGLDNRVAFIEHLARSMAAGARSGCSVALIAIDLDDFKSVNDTLGHEAGDAVLSEVGRRLRATCRKDDLVARLGGDEFAVIAGNVRAKTDAAIVARNIVVALAEPIEAMESTMFIGASVGIALYPSDEVDGEKLLRCADLAAYEAKKEGGGRYRFFDEKLQVQAARQIRIVRSLRKAIKRPALIVPAYQPIVDLASGRTVAVEGLFRWDQAVSFNARPSEVIDVAERMGLMEELGAEILRQCCADCAKWQSGQLSGIGVAVNVSAKHLISKSFIPHVEAALESAGLQANLLRIEMTEDALLQDGAAVIETLSSLRARDIGTCVDDFGTGLSSVTRLAELPIDNLKIDQRLVATLHDTRSRLTFRAVMAVGRSLELKVVAEGIETDEQKGIVLDEGCAEGQGFLFARPAPFGELLGASSLDQGAGAPSDGHGTRETRMNARLM